MGGVGAGGLGCGGRGGGRGTQEHASELVLGFESDISVKKPLNTPVALRNE